MIHHVSGDILLSKAKALAHGIAPNDPFSSGLALSLRQHWPAMYKDFRHFCQTNHPKTGTAWIWSGANGQTIVNLLTQEAAYGQGGKPGKATLENVNHALRELRRLIETEKFISLALPRLATGVGGLDWKDVEPLIARHLGDLPVTVHIYTTYQIGVAAPESA